MTGAGRGRSVGVVGGGILGVALAHRLATTTDDRVVLFEKEAELGLHQTGRNSGVVHAGLYYPPGSLKARLCRRGGGLLREFCERQGLAYDECGKLLVALDDHELGRLRNIQDRAVANGVPDIRPVTPPEMAEIEPHVQGVAGLHSPRTAIVDFRSVTAALGAEAADRGAVIHTCFRVDGLDVGTSEVVVRGSAGVERVDQLVLCAGLQADHVARLAGDTADPEIVPFRGEYRALRADATHLVRGLVYPVPDPRYPFLGIHLTRRVDGSVLVGPNAVLALAREGYGWSNVERAELTGLLRSKGVRRLAVQHWRTGVAEVAGSLSRNRFAARARRYVPALRAEQLMPAHSGVRAQAVDRDGTMVDDFRIHRRGPVVAVRNAPSPAATSAMAIAEHLAEILLVG